METIGTKKNEPKFVCEKCDYSCFYPADWSRHISTRKHKTNNVWKQIEINGENDKNVNGDYICDKCNKQYGSRTGLWKHTKKCVSNNNTTEKDIIMLLVKENNELKTFMSKQHALMLKVIEKDANFSDQYNKIIIENMGGQGDNDLEK
jgi:hypothetical protein